jgi:hypothetical protein
LPFPLQGPFSFPTLISGYPKNFTSIKITCCQASLQALTHFLKIYITIKLSHVVLIIGKMDGWAETLIDRQTNRQMDRSEIDRYIDR